MIRVAAALPAAVLAAVLAGVRDSPRHADADADGACRPGHGARPVFLDRLTYAVAIRGDGGRSALKVLCDVTATTAYRLRYNRFGWPTCSARELYVGLDGRQVEDVPSGQRWPLPDGRWLEILPIIDVGVGVDGQPSPGRYALAALSARSDEIEILTGPLVVYRIASGRIHFLGEIGADGLPTGRDTAAFAALFGDVFPEVDSRRLELSEASGVSMTCEEFRGISATPATLGFNCTGVRATRPEFARSSP